jgi:type II secretory pathway component PulF
VLAQELANGVSLSSGLAQWPQVFPPLYLAMIRTGELTGVEGPIDGGKFRQNEKQHRHDQRQR